MGRIIWTPEALRNLEAIGDYATEFAPTHAARLLQRLHVAVNPLEDFPNMGRSVPGFSRRDLRELIVGDYRIIYQLHEERVWLIAIRHASSDVEQWLRSRGF